MRDRHRNDVSGPADLDDCQGILEEMLGGEVVCRDVRFAVTTEVQGQPSPMPAGTGEER
jgi:hypothetical protein